MTEKSRILAVDDKPFFGPDLLRAGDSAAATLRLTVERVDVTELKQSQLSPMPEGLLDALTEEQTANLIAYLMSKQQVPLPETAK